MTIRERVGKKKKLFLGIAIGSWVVANATMLFHVSDTIIIWVGMAGFIAGVVGVAFFIRCPRCRGNLGHHVVTQLPGTRAKYKVNFCPYCGVSFDE
jgi:hypothetical protein